MAKDTDPRARPTTPVGAVPRPAAGRRRVRRWTPVLFAIEVAIVVALVWFSWASGSWG